MTLGIIIIGLMIIGAIAIALKYAYTQGKVCGVGDALGITDYELRITNWE